MWHGDAAEEQALRAAHAHIRRAPKQGRSPTCTGTSAARSRMRFTTAGCSSHHKEKRQHRHKEQKRDFTKISRLKKNLLLMTVRSSTPKKLKNCKKSYWDEKRLGKFLNSHKIANTKILRLKERTFIKSYMKQT